MANKNQERFLEPKDENAKLLKIANKEEIKKQLNKLDNHPGLKFIVKEFGAIEAEEKIRLRERYLREIIIEKGESQLRFWKRVKTFSFILGILFLVVLYLSFWFIAKDLNVAEESFTNLFCIS